MSGRLDGRPPSSPGSAASAPPSLTGSPQPVTVVVGDLAESDTHDSRMLDVSDEGIEAFVAGVVADHGRLDIVEQRRDHVRDADRRTDLDS